MKNILMVRSEKAYLPQIEASIKYFKKKSSGFQLHDSAAFPKLDERDFDCVWKFTGIDPRKKRLMPVIHEYASLSTGKWPIVKNKVKKMINVQPDLRIYLNASVRNGFGFKDQAPFVYRDMGVDDIFFQDQRTPKLFDCVYTGSITKERGIHHLLHFFKEQAKHRRLLLIGRVADDLYEAYASCSNITFTGNVSYQEVPALASQAICGINYMPNKYPFHLQTSTKLLEYLALGLHVVTTDYLWIRHFMQENQLSFSFIDENLSGLENALNTISLPDKKVDMEPYRWSAVIEKSGLEQKLQELLQS